MYWFLLSLILCSSTVHSQSISTTTPIPPLQWINLTPLLTGSSAAPPLKDASIGYDENRRNLLVFGGESAQGFPQAQTYLLNLDSLIWTPPVSPNGLTDKPPARSAAISGDDTAASYRQAHVVIGGKGSDGQPLSDVWAFDYSSQFWAQVSIRGQSPSPRWGAAGGIDIRTEPIQDPIIVGPNNSFYLAGGFNGSSPIPLSDIWRLNISGILSANNLGAVFGSWEPVSIQGTLPAKIDIGGTVVLQGSQQHIVAAGGCSTSSTSDNSCADGTSYVINIDVQNQQTSASCPAPRFGPALAPNSMSQTSGSFNSQAFMLLGTFDTSLWDDGGGLQNGEVAILDINGGGWTRVLPAGDPGNVTGGKPTFPSPREGAAVLSFHQGLVGNAATRALTSDTIVFGGKDASGNYLDEIWVLRAYNGTITQSNQHWSGFGDGSLRGGVDADGEGVTAQYLTKCATALKSTSSGSSSSPTQSKTPGPSGTNLPSASSPNLYDTSVIHKILAPVSVALVLPAVFIYRLSTPSVVSPHLREHRMALFYLSIVVAVAAFGVGIGGLANSFTSVTYIGALMKRSGSLNLVTAHGRAGLALFASLYILVPVLLVISACTKPRKLDTSEPPTTGRPRTNSNETAEKLGLFSNRVGSPPPTVNGTLEEQAPSLPSEPRQPARSWNSLSPWPISRGAGRRSSESALDAASSPSTLRSFEVTNRPSRVRHASGNSLAALTDPRSAQQRSLGEMGWRRSITPVGELDYALNQLQSRVRHPSTPGTAMMDITSTRGLMAVTADLHAPRMPCTFDIVLHLLLHALLLGLCVFSLFALRSRGTTAGFAIFLAWTIVFYIGLFVLAWNGVPRESILTVIFGRLRTEPHAMPVPTSPGPSRPLSNIGLDSIPFPSDPRGPYQHQPPFRTAHDHDYPLSAHGHDTREAEYEDDEDEESRQRRIEEEMSRRDVSIVTVPKRKLFLTNPEVS